MKHDVPSRALATTSSCSSLEFAFVLRILASILCNCDAPSEPMRCVSSLFAPSGRFFSAPRRMRSATETLAFFLRGGRILWVNLSILSFVRGAALASRRSARGCGGSARRARRLLLCGSLRAAALAALGRSWHGAQRWARGRGTAAYSPGTPRFACAAPRACRNSLCNSANDAAGSMLAASKTLASMLATQLDGRGPSYLGGEQ